MQKLREDSPKVNIEGGKGGRGSRSRFTENKTVLSQFTEDKIGISRFTGKKGMFSLNKSCIPLYFENLRTKQSLVVFTIHEIRVPGAAKRKPSSEFRISQKCTIVLHSSLSDELSSYSES